MSLSREDWNDVSQLQTRGGRLVKSASLTFANDMSNPQRFGFYVQIEGVDGEWFYPESGLWYYESGILSDNDIIKKPTTSDQDGPERDWPAIWRRKMREHIERCPMVPSKYIDEVIRAIKIYDRNYIECEESTQ